MKDNSRTLLVAFSGKMGCGKTTLSEYLKKWMEENKFSPQILLKPFGDAIKSEVSEYFGFDKGLCYTQEGKRTEIELRKFLMWYPEGYKAGDLVTVRKLMQLYAGFRRAQDPDYWLYAWRKQIELFPSPSEERIRVIIVDDVRMPNEVTLVRSYPHNILIRLRPYPGYEKNYPEEDNDSTETSLNDMRPEDFDLDVYPAYGELLNVLGELTEKVMEIKFS